MVLKEIRLKMVGMKFQKPSKVPQWNDAVTLVHEKDNPHDPNAVAILNSLDERIGYVGTPKTVSRGNRKNGCIDNQQLLHEMDLDNDRYIAFISKARDGFGFINVVVGE